MPPSPPTAGAWLTMPRTSSAASTPSSTPRAAAWLAVLEKMDVDAWRHDHAVNVLGPMLVAGAALEHLGPDGIVGIVSSEAAVDIRYGLASYASSKAALDQAIAGWRVERPERRFIRISMGSTMPTEFASGFDPALLGVALERWMARGLSPMDLMETDDVGRQMAELFAVFLAHPRIDVREIRLSPRGSPNP